MKKRIFLVINIIIIYIISSITVMGENNVDFYSRDNPYYVLVNKQNALGKEYKPKDLMIPNVRFLEKGVLEKKFMQRTAASHLETMFNSAAKDNIHLVALSGYRSYQRQNTIYNSNLKKYGQAYTDSVSAKPGHSEHQTGLAMDISAKSAGYSLTQRFGLTKEGKWLADNAHHYGYIIRYQKGKEHITGYTYEPWHIRYVGKELASYLYINKLTLEEAEPYFIQAELIQKNTNKSTMPDEVNNQKEDTEEMSSSMQQITSSIFLDERAKSVDSQ